MAFKIALTPTYCTKITVELLNKQGRYEKSDFMAEFKRLNGDQLNDVRELPQRDVLKEVLVGWSGLIDENNDDVPFNAATFEAVLAIPQAFAALAQGYWDSIYKAKEKN